MVAIYRQMRRDSISASRAFVFSSSFTAVWLHDPKNERRIVAWRIFPVWENSGGTVAEEVKSYVSWKAFTGAMPSDYDFPDIGTERIIPPSLVGPHSTVNGPSSEISVAFLVAAKRGMCQIYIWGWTEYKEIFNPGIIHRTEFCAKLVVHGDPRFTNCVFAYPFYGKHNATDGNCYRRPGEGAPLRDEPSISVAIPVDALEEFGIMAAEIQQTHGAPPAP
jgi:hypothetical protein